MDLILNNIKNSLQNKRTAETGFSHFRPLTDSILKGGFNKTHSFFSIELCSLFGYFFSSDQQYPSSLLISSDKKLWFIRAFPQLYLAAFIVVLCFIQLSSVIFFLLVNIWSMQGIYLFSLLHPCQLWYLFLLVILWTLQ